MQAGAGMGRITLAENRNSGEHTFASLIAELKDESVEFVQTRLQMLISELRAHSDDARKSARFSGIALFFAGLGFLLLSVAAVALVTVAFWGSPFAFFWGFFIVGICYLLLSGITSIVAYFALKGLAPEKTMKVLHDDKAWARGESILRGIRLSAVKQESSPTKP